MPGKHATELISSITKINTSKYASSYMEGNNTWIANYVGSTLAIPVGVLAQHVLSSIFYFTQNGYPIYDDIEKSQYLHKK